MTMSIFVANMSLKFEEWDNKTLRVICPERLKLSSISHA